jgi:hypothetical protein
MFSLSSHYLFIKSPFETAIKLSRVFYIDHIQAAAGRGVQVLQRSLGQRREEGGQSGHIHAHDH